MWIEHDDTFYNLDNYNMITRGDGDEILLSTESHNGVWNNEKMHASLLFKSREDRELAFKTLQVKLSVKYI